MDTQCVPAERFHSIEMHRIHSAHFTAFICHFTAYANRSISQHLQTAHAISQHMQIAYAPSLFHIYAISYSWTGLACAAFVRQSVRPTTWRASNASSHAPAFLVKKKNENICLIRRDMSGDPSYTSTSSSPV
jgi:hypothetical protein